MINGNILGLTGFLLIPLVIWVIIWKGWALWRAAKNGSKVWFIVLLVLNTVGILDILYIFIFSKVKRSRAR
jgi:hypothetical protein